MRQLNRLLAALLSLFLVVAGVLLIIEVVADRIHHRPAIVHWHSSYDWLGRTQWQSGSVRVTCVILVLAGLVLLFFELKRPRVSRLTATDEGTGIDTAYTRRGVAAAVKSAVSDIDGIRSVDASVGRRKVVVSAVSAAADRAAAEQLRSPVTAAAQQRLDSLGLKSTPSLSATVRPRSS